MDSTTTQAVTDAAQKSGSFLKRFPVKAAILAVVGGGLFLISRGIQTRMFASDEEIPETPVQTVVEESAEA